MAKTGDKYGRWTLIHPDEKTDKKWICKCDCGTLKSVWLSNITSGKTKSCGCYGREALSLRDYKHGGAKERLYHVWCNMRRRCYDPKNNRYQNYGGKGVKVCDEWQDYATFREWAYSTGYDDKATYGKCTIERIDVDGNYEPSNCTWKTIKEQCYNRTSNRYLSFNGKTQTITEWEKELHLPKDRIGDRLRKGWSIERALSTPLRYHYGNKAAV